MAQRRVTQSQSAKLVAILSLSSTGAPATGLTASALTCQYRKAGGVFTPKSLTGSFTEIGSGVYEVDFSASELDTLGQFLFTITGGTIAQFVGDAEVIAATQASTATSVITCMVSDALYDVTGLPVVGAVVTARIVGAPQTQGKVALSKNDVSAVTDANGVFFLALARLAEVVVMIPSAGYQRRLTVPNQATAQLFAIP